MDERVDKPAPLAFSTRAEKLREKLTEEIIGGALAPGTKLDEQELANRYGVSRTPVREAIRQLIATGLVQSRPHRGATVAGFSSERLTEYLEVATEIEIACVRLAATKMKAEELAHIAALHAKMGDMLNDPNRFSVLNDQFHEAIFVGTHNGVLVEMAHALQVRTRPIFRVQLTISLRTRQSYAEHEKILAALLRGDAASAELAMRVHMQASTLELERLHRSISVSGEDK